jgi:hypothetical protein
MMPPARPRTALLGLVVLAVLASSCGRGPRCYPVHGQVFVGGQPATGALVVFVPVSPPGGAGGAATGRKIQARPEPTATVGADGSFTLSTYDPGSRTTQDGAPPGKYDVSIVWLPDNAEEVAKADPKGEAPDRLQGHYSNAAKSGLHAEVQEGPTEVPPFKLDAVGKETKK